MLAMSARRAQVPTSSSGVASARFAVSEIVASSAASTRWPSVWPSGMSRTPAEIQLAASACRKACSAASQAMPWPAQATPTAIGSATGPSQTAAKCVQRRAGPRRARHVKEGAALRRRLQKSLLRWDKGGGKLGDGAQRGIVVRRRWRDERERRKPHRKTAAIAHHHLKPCPQRLGVLDVAGFDRPFDAARIGESADRIGRRQPGHQAIKRRGVQRIIRPARRAAG